MTAVPFAHLIPPNLTEDARQDAICILLEHDPADAHEAQRLLDQHRYRAEHARRKQPFQLTLDPGPNEEFRESSVIYPALSSLSDEDRQLIEAHYVLGLTFAEMEVVFGIPHSTLHRRIAAAVDRLKEIVTNISR